MIQAAGHSAIYPDVGAEGRARARADPRQGRQPARSRRSSSRASRSPRTSRSCCGRRLPTRSRRKGSAATSTGCSCRRATRTRGRRQKRVRPAPMGRAFRVLKRTAHLTVHVSERPRKVSRSARRRRRGAAAKRARAEVGDDAVEKSTEGEGVTVGQKVHPFGFRLGFNKTWRSRWASGPRLREAAARGSGAALDPQEALRARRRLEDRDRARGQPA